MDTVEIDELAKECLELKVVKDEASHTFDEAKSAYEKVQEKLCEAMTIVGKEKWEIPGYRAIKISIRTFWNIVDYGALLNQYLKDTSIAKLNGKNIQAWANAEYKEGKDLSGYGIEPYEKLSISGGKPE